MYMTANGFQTRKMTKLQWMRNTSNFWYDLELDEVVFQIAVQIQEVHQGPLRKII